MLEEMLKTHHGVVTRRHLLSVGCSDSDIRRAVRTGALTRLRPGWYRGAMAKDAVVRAVQAGGALSCVGALKLHGAWVPPGTDLHVRRSPYHRARKPAKARGCRCPGRPRAAVSQSVDSLSEAVTAATSCLGTEAAVAVLDSILERDLMRLEELTGLLSGLPGRRHLLDLIDQRAQSGTETFSRLRLRSCRIRLRPQVTIGDIGRVDLLAGERLVIEVDSRAHHTSAHHYARDRARDRRLVSLGYIVVRLTYEDVMYDWDTVVADIIAIVRQRRHNRPLPSSRRSSQHRRARRASLCSTL